jgi:NADH-quinone oxidoreductase subunit J
VDFPALLPDGTPAALSVSPVIAGRAGAREAVSEALREAAGALPAGPSVEAQPDRPAEPGPAGLGQPVQPSQPAGEDANGNGQEGPRS